ncbi:MAG: glutamate--tRNA ligase family protein [Edaphocola sp.]
MNFKLTRIAPTPSGYLHLGNVFSFAVTAALAQKVGAAVLLRIDDMDRERVRPAYVEDIFATLNFLRIDWQAGPADARDFEENWRQKARMPLYAAAKEYLLSANKLYACVCSRAALAAAKGVCRCQEKKLPIDTPGAALRLTTPNVQPIVCKTIDGAINTRLPAEMQQMVVWKKDGMPAYQLSSLVDDVHFDTDLIVRGSDLWPSTCAQLHLATVLGYARFLDCTFLHHPLLQLPSGEKLSKSAGAASLHHLRQHGAAPEMVLKKIAANFGLGGKYANSNKLVESLAAAGCLPALLAH